MNKVLNSNKHVKWGIRKIYVLKKVLNSKKHVLSDVLNGNKYNTKNVLLKASKTAIYTY